MTELVVSATELVSMGATVADVSTGAEVSTEAEVSTGATDSVLLSTGAAELSDV